MKAQEVKPPAQTDWLAYYEIFNVARRREKEKWVQMHPLGRDFVPLNWTSHICVGRFPVNISSIINSGISSISGVGVNLLGLRSSMDKS